jgi:hypothetical protein
MLSVQAHLSWTRFGTIKIKFRDIIQTTEQNMSRHENSFMTIYNLCVPFCKLKVGLEPHACRFLLIPSFSTLKCELKLSYTFQIPSHIVLVEGAAGTNTLGTVCKDHAYRVQGTTPRKSTEQYYKK